MAVSSPYAVFRAEDLPWTQALATPLHLPVKRLSPLSKPHTTPPPRPRKRQARGLRLALVIQGELFEPSHAG